MQKTPDPSGHPIYDSANDNEDDCCKCACDELKKIREMLHLMGTFAFATLSVLDHIPDETAKNVIIKLNEINGGPHDVNP